ncbi:hypothetical protein, partial [Streptomyces sp. AS02]|uniref:hypothetical protein n=1 Tax=Streptomyces sp. AS02 TaxID=2938946 RepID=UPI002020D8C8
MASISEVDQSSLTLINGERLTHNEILTFIYMIEDTLNHSLSDYFTLTDAIVSLKSGSYTKKETIQNIIDNNYSTGFM